LWPIFDREGSLHSESARAKDAAQSSPEGRLCAIAAEPHDPGVLDGDVLDDLSLQSRHSAIGQLAPKAILRVAALKAFSREFQSAAGGVGK